MTDLGVHHDAVDDVLGRAYPGLSVGELDRKLGIRVLEASPERIVATMPVETNTQSFGLLHGGATLALAEAVGSWGAVMHAGPGPAVVGVDVNATHHRGARSGPVTAVSTPLHRGGTIATYNVSITDEQDRLVCTARVTSLIRPARTPG
jgi:1,4-dihydroxy-2-naphthoyl-CoA hydrolase